MTCNFGKWYGIFSGQQAGSSFVSNLILSSNARLAVYLLHNLLLRWYILNKYLPRPFYFCDFRKKNCFPRDLFKQGSFNRNKSVNNQKITKVSIKLKHKHQTKHETVTKTSNQTIVSILAISLPVLWKSVKWMWSSQQLAVEWIYS